MGGKEVRNGRNRSKGKREEEEKKRGDIYMNCHAVPFPFKSTHEKEYPDSLLT